MKRTILYISILTMLALSGVQAQTVSSGSRLNLASKKKAIPVENMKFTAIAPGLSYKPLSLQNPKALNSFYRSFLFSNAGNQDSQTILTAEVIEKGLERKSPAMEAQLKAEELLYVNDKISVSNVYPNPASEYAEVDYSIAPGVRDVKLVFYNVLGSQMQQFTLDKADRKLRVNTKDMPTGLYFYQLSLEGKKVATKKMLVRHQQ